MDGARSEASGIDRRAESSKKRETREEVVERGAKGGKVCRALIQSLRRGK